jgi:hypothetical protein
VGGSNSSTQIADTENAPRRPELKYVKSRSAWFCSPPQQGRGAARHVLFWSGGGHYPAAWHIDRISLHVRAGLEFEHHEPRRHRLAIGAMVDAAIVMIENAHKRLERAAPDKTRTEVIIERFGSSLKHV